MSTLATSDLATLLRAVAEHLDPAERTLPLSEVARRLGMVPANTPDDSPAVHEATEHIRRSTLRHELPVTKLDRTTLVVREASLNEFIRNRERLSRKPQRIRRTA